MRSSTTMPSWLLAALRMPCLGRYWRDCYVWPTIPVTQGSNSTSTQREWANKDQEGNIRLLRVRQGASSHQQFFTATLEHIFSKLIWGNKAVKIDGEILNNLCSADEIFLYAQNHHNEYNRCYKRMGIPMTEVNNWVKNRHPIVYTHSTPIAEEFLRKSLVPNSPQFLPQRSGKFSETPCTAQPWLPSGKRPQRRTIGLTPNRPKWDPSSRLSAPPFWSTNGQPGKETCRFSELPGARFNKPRGDVQTSIGHSSARM